MQGSPGSLTITLLSRWRNSGKASDPARISENPNTHFMIDFARAMNEEENAGRRALFLFNAVDAVD